VGDFWQLTVLTLAAAAVYAARGKRTSAAMLLVAVPLGAGVANLLKLVFMRARPAVEALIPMPETYSFPSSHAVSSFALFGALAFLAVLHRASLKRAAVSVALYAVAAACIGLSRVYLGVHYLGDVIGGWLVGAAWLALIVLVFARWGTGDGDGGPTSRGAAGA
jgi:undecaprenyl-diphosphatase